MGNVVHSARGRLVLVAGSLFAFRNESIALGLGSVALAGLQC